MKNLKVQKKWWHRLIVCWTDLNMQFDRSVQDMMSPCHHFFCTSECWDHPF